MTKLKDPEAKKLFLSGKKVLEELESSDLFATTHVIDDDTHEDQLDDHTNKRNINRVVSENHNIKKDWLMNQYPVFDISEIVIGPVLGHGGFGIVNEVQDIILTMNIDNQNSRTNRNLLLHPIVVHEEDDTTTESDSDNNNNNSKQRRHKAIEGYDNFDGNLARSYLAANVRRPTTLSRGIHRNNKHNPISTTSNETSNNDNSTAARYAIKRLKSDLNELNRVRGSIDLAIEVKLLSQLHHPNIGKLSKYIVLDK
jgi:hypothetical protein